MKQRKPAAAAMRTDVQKIGKFPDLIHLDLMAGLGRLGGNGGFICCLNRCGKRLRLDLAEIRMLASQKPATAFAFPARLLRTGRFAQDQLGEATPKRKFSDTPRTMQQQGLRKVLPSRLQLAPRIGGPGMDCHSWPISGSN